METAATTLNEAIAAQPVWLQGWVMVLVLTHLVALRFVVRRGESGKLIPRPQPIAILLSFFAAAALMSWLFAQDGYTRLLGLAHLVFWTPVWIWVLLTRSKSEGWALRGYLGLYLVIAGLSLVIDLIDLIRYLASAS